MPRATPGRFARFFAMFLGLFVCAGLTGCVPAAHVAWSPDGNHAAYFVPVAGKLLPGSGFVLDPAGKVTTELGPAFGSFAWSNDSATLYFGGYNKDGPVADAAIHKWLVDAEDNLPATGQANDEYPAMALCRWNDGKIEKLAPLGNRYVMFVEASPDQSWIAVMVFAKKSESDDGHTELFVYSTGSKKLYEVSEHCGYAVCFTGPAKLVYAEANHQKSGPMTTGQIVEVQLDDSTEMLERKALVDVLWEATSCIRPTADGLLFTTIPFTFPTRASRRADDPAPTLFRYTRADGGVAAMAESTNGLFMPSPDGKRILYIKRTPMPGASPAEKQELAVMNANGSDTHVLMDITGFGQQIPMWPTWHGNDQITFVGTTALDLPQMAGEEPRIALDIVLYKITPGFTLEPAQTLSTGWPMEMKPSMKKAEYVR